jgi:hypothetical protein
VVYFPDLKVVAVGDLYATAPNPDFFSRWKHGGLGPRARPDSAIGLRRRGAGHWAHGH